MIARPRSHPPRRLSPPWRARPILTTLTVVVLTYWPAQALALAAPRLAALPDGLAVLGQAVMLLAMVGLTTLAVYGHVHLRRPPRARAASPSCGVSTSDTGAGTVRTHDDSPDTPY